MERTAPGSARAAPPPVRKFADVYPGVKDRCLKYTAASKWQQVERMTPGLAKLWVQQMSLWTRTTFKMRGHVYANCPHPKLRQKLLEVVAEEDIVDPRIGMNHRQLLVSSFGRATGQRLEDLERARPLPTTLVTLDIFFAIANRTWEEGIAIASGHERVLRDSGFFGFEARRMKRDLGWSEDDLAWYTGHDVADEDHGAIVELLDDYITEDATWDRVEEAIIEAQLAWLVLLDGVVDAYTQNIQPVSGASCKGLSFVF
jgi:pyrroloquinoline quinone (PQQ) biosynthesis protein C